MNKTEEIFQIYLSKKTTSKKPSYYINGLWFNSYFYENIENIPYLLLIGIIWSIFHHDEDWDSNEGGKQLINDFSNEFDIISCSSRGNGYPVYHLFEYFKIETPKVLKNKHWINDIAGENSDEIEKHIKENYFDFITYLFDHSNNIILEHEKNLKENHLQKYFKVSEYFDQWKNIYENNNYVNDKQFTRKKEYILNLINNTNN